MQLQHLLHDIYFDYLNSYDIQTVAISHKRRIAEHPAAAETDTLLSTGRTLAARGVTKTLSLNPATNLLGTG